MALEGEDGRGMALEGEDGMPIPTEEELLECNGEAENAGIAKAGKKKPWGNRGAGHRGGWAQEPEE